MAEAVVMSLNITGKRKVLISRGVHPHYRKVLQTTLSDLPAVYEEVPIKEGVTDMDVMKSMLVADTAAVVVQSPNFLGHIEKVEIASQLAHANGSLCIQSYNPISLGLLKRPGEMDVDIATSEGQPLGTPLQFGGPYLGLFACKTEFMRKMPGRLIGQTTDLDGKRAFCLTLQTREQHIRREKATSNVCTNQGLLALRACVYLATMGSQGMREVAQLCYNKTQYLINCLVKAGVGQKFSRQPVFNEVLIRTRRPVKQVLEDASHRNILAGYDIGRDYPELSDSILVAVTEKRTKAEIDKLVELLAK